MIKVHIHSKYKKVSVSAMMDSGATEAFIDKTICDKHQIPPKLAEKPWEIYLADRNLSKMGPISHIAKVPMGIGGHQEQAMLQVANLQNQEIILGMPWLKRHNSKIHWENEKITFDSEQCVTWCLDKPATVYVVSEIKAREDNLITRFIEIQTEDLRLGVKILISKARIPTKRSRRAAGHDLYAQETRIRPAKRQGLISTRIALGLPCGTYWRIVPRSCLAVEHSLTVNTGVIDADYTREIKVVLVNLGTENYKVHEGDKVAELIVERIISDEAILVQDLEATKRGMKGFGSSDKDMTKQAGPSADLLTKSPLQKEKYSSNKSTYQETPKPQMMTKEVGAASDCLVNNSEKVRGQLETQGSYDQHPKMAKRPLSELCQETPQKRTKPEMMTKQVGAAPDCLVSHPPEISGPTEEGKSQRTLKSTPVQGGEIHISEITQKEFRKDYRNGETTGVVKISQKENQIYLRRINISSELAIETRKN